MKLFLLGLVVGAAVVVLAPVISELTKDARRQRQWEDLCPWPGGRPS